MIGVFGGGGLLLFFFLMYQATQGKVPMAYGIAVAIITGLGVPILEGIEQKKRQKILDAEEEAERYAIANSEKTRKARERAEQEEEEDYQDERKRKRRLKEAHTEIEIQVQTLKRLHDANMSCEEDFLKIRRMVAAIDDAEARAIQERAVNDLESMFKKG